MLLGAHLGHTLLGALGCACTRVGPPSAHTRERAHQGARAPSARAPGHTLAPGHARTASRTPCLARTHLVKHAWAPGLPHSHGRTRCKCGILGTCAILGVRKPWRMQDFVVLSSVLLGMCRALSEWCGFVSLGVESMPGGRRIDLSRTHAWTQAGLIQSHVAFFLRLCYLNFHHLQSTRIHLRKKIDFDYTKKISLYKLT